MSLGRTPKSASYIKGRKFGLGRKDELLSNLIEVTSPCVDATITVAAESPTDVRDITIQLKDARGRDIDFVEMVELFVFADAAAAAFATTGGSTGLAIDGDGALLAVVAKKYFKATSEADGDIGLTWTDTAGEVAYLGVRLPNGRLVISDALTTAG